MSQFGVPAYRGLKGVQPAGEHEVAEGDCNLPRACGMGMLPDAKVMGCTAAGASAARPSQQQKDTCNKKELRGSRGVAFISHQAPGRTLCLQLLLAVGDECSAPSVSQASAHVCKRQCMQKRLRLACGGI